MKAIIVKDNNFKTVGIKVTTNSGLSLFDWGISPMSPVYFQKEISATNWLCEIVDIIELSSRIAERNEFRRTAFNLVTEGTMMNFKDHDEETARMTNKMVDLIGKII